jgi:eukaryotic-like serine/threonine-protein kinase
VPLVDELYRRRAEAFTSASAEPLSGVYSDGSDRLAADTDFVESLAAAGEVLRGYAPSVVRVAAADVTGDRAVLQVVDRVPAYEVVPSAGGPAVRSEPGRGEVTVRMVLRRSADGWRIESAQRVSG